MADCQALFATHRGGLLRYLTRAVGHADTAQDLTQEVFLRMSTAALPTNSEQHRAWIFRIARNLAIDHHRRQLHRRTEPISDTFLGGTGVGTAHTAAVVNQALSRLEPLARDVFLMREVSGLSYAEIAEACDLTPDGVRSRIHRARLELRAQLSAPIDAARGSALRLHPHPTQ